jgi:starch-binding outer membrane protein, SusD/RagB family
MNKRKNKTMKNIILISRKLILMASVLLMIPIGCMDLDEEPLDFPSPENFYSTQDQIISGLTGAMASMYSQWGNYSYGWGAFHDDANDNTNLNFQASHANWVWRAHYRSIANLNPIIQALIDDKLGPTVAQDVKDELIAQAKFIRAFNYFVLVRAYGEVPIITEETDLVSGEISRQPIRDVYDLIIADLQVALNGLPEMWEQYKGRPTKDAARALLAKAYLTMASAPLKDMSYAQNARDMAKAVMDNNVHSLIPDIRDVFKIENKLGPEYIWGFNATSDDIATPPQIWLPGSMAFGWLDFGTERTWALRYPDQPRKEAYMILEDWDGDSYEDFSWRGSPPVRKYTYDDQETLERLQSTANIPLLRYADVLLMFAEAENMINGGPTQAAVDAVNQIIDRANDGAANPNHPRVTTSMSQAEFDAAVIQERNYELFFEYDRWFDLVRKEILCDVWPDLPDIMANCNENDYLWPIPQADLRLNSLMTQNPGYASPGPD